MPARHTSSIDARKQPRMHDDLDRFRERARSFLTIHARPAATSTDDPRGDLALDQALAFQRALHAAGLAGLSVSPAYGGHGLSAAHETAWREEAGRFPLMTEELSITLGNCLPTLLEFGTDAQRRRHVPRILAGREVWCQLFSEPGAGSDIAGVQTRAAPVAGGWLVNGQKVWTTLAHRAHFGILLARTDPTVAKHDGLSMLIVDLNAPGVEVRPIRQLDGAMHFDEVFLSDVFVPAAAVLPPAGGGWRIASAMLHHQRVARATGQRGGVRHDRTDRLVAEVRRRGLTDPTVARRAGAALHGRGLPEPARHAIGGGRRAGNRPWSHRFAREAHQRPRRPAVRPAGLAHRGSGRTGVGGPGAGVHRRGSRSRSAVGGRRPLHAVAVHRRRHERDPAIDRRRARARPAPRPAVPSTNRAAALAS